MERTPSQLCLSQALLHGLCQEIVGGRRRTRHDLVSVRVQMSDSSVLYKRPGCTGESVLAEVVEDEGALQRP